MKNKESTVTTAAYLTDMEYCHVINTTTGKVSLVEGPARLKYKLGLFHKVHGSVKEKVIVNEDEYAVVMNPVDKKSKKLQAGKWELRDGPVMFSMHPGEKIWGGAIDKIQYLEMGEYVTVLNPFEDGTNVYGKRKIITGKTSYKPLPGEKYSKKKHTIVLKNNQGMYIKAVRDFIDNEIERKAGDEWLVKGPLYYLPTDDVEITERKIDEVSLAEHSGIYIKNVITGKVRLEQGPKTIMLEPHEIKWNKEYTQSEIEAIWRPSLNKGADKNRGRKFDPMDIINFDPAIAQPLWVLENEAIKIMSQDKASRIEFGPVVLLLEAYERPFVMTIAGGTPKNTKRLKIWKIKLGPNFSTDELDVRTSDNAEITIKVRYKWKFDVNKEDAVEAEKIFSVSDFVGLATETMASKIRDEAAKHTFEELHSKCSEILKVAVFGTAGNEEFEFENGFKIFGLDIKEIRPKDEEIAHQMNDAITANMQIVVDKVKLEAELLSEKQRTEKTRDIEVSKKDLITAQQENIKLEKTGDATAEAEAILIKARAEAESIKIKKIAEAEGEAEKIQKVLDMLVDKDGEFNRYLEIQKVEALKNIEKLAIIPEGSNTLFSITDLLRKQ
jgi:major vault protein